VSSDKTVSPESVVSFKQFLDRNERKAHGGQPGTGSGEHGGHQSSVGTTALALGALGVVYGDIGTSPLYSLKEAFTEKSHVLAVDRINVFGVCSLAFWSLLIIISVKYLMLVMRADNRGEGGILALTALVMPRRARAPLPSRSKSSFFVSRLAVSKESEHKLPRQ
jgi:KUP system potassium uptake protein